MGERKDGRRDELMEGAMKGGVKEVVERGAEPLHLLILAAGKGTRMRSQTPKVLHQVAGLSLLEHALKGAQQVQPDSITVVLSPDQGETETLLKRAYPTVQIAYQATPRGTGDAVLAARPFLENAPGTVLILFADTPLLRPETLRRLADHAVVTQAAVTLLGVEAPGHPAYGRLVQDEDGGVQRIVEMKDATAAEQQIPLCNSGLMACQGSVLFSLLEAISPRNQAGEYYLTDCVEKARAAGLAVTALKAKDATEVLGINTRQDLAAAEAVFQDRLRVRALEAGATLLDPRSVYFAHDTVVSEDVTLHPHVVFGPGVRLERGVTVQAFSHLEGAHVKAGASIGPYARLRPDTILEAEARVGNFVELKKTTLGRGAKVNHLSYLGDAVVGDTCNIGAGTITCNYNGYQKHTTRIEDGAFVGSNSTLIAPVKVGAGAYVAAATVVTRDVGAEALALSRVPQVEKEGGGARLRQRLARAKGEDEAPAQGENFTKDRAKGR